MAHTPRESLDQGSANDYYARLWESERWGGPDPNYDEQLRLAVINELIQRHIYAGKPLERILDVGCGRGWLTHQLRQFGNVQGLEVVPEAVDIAKHLFPDLVFAIANPAGMTTDEVQHFGNADLVVSSEVLEHVPNADKPGFFRGLAALIKPGGHLLITTPRAEFWQQWLALAPECQPIEEWVTEAGLSELAKAAGFQIVAKRRVYLYGHDHHRGTAWLLQGKVWPRLLRLIKPLGKVVLHANGFYQVALFRRKNTLTVE